MITSYGLIAALSLLSLLLGAGLYLHARKIPYAAIIRFGALSVPLALIFSRLLFALTALGCRDVFSSPVQMLYVHDGGASITGAFVGVVLAAWLVSRWQKISAATLMDGIALGAPIAIIIERLAEPAHELGLGRYVDTEALQFLGSLTEGRHPVYLYEAIIAGLILLALILMHLRSRKRPGDLMLTFLTLYGCTQTLLESLRDDQHMVIYFIRINQIAAIIMAVIAFTLWLLRWKRQGARKHSVILACVLVTLGIAQGIVQEFAVDSNPNLLLEYGIMAACLAVIAIVSLTIRRKAV